MAEPTIADVLAAIRGLEANLIGRTESLSVDILARLDALDATVAEIVNDLQRQRDRTDGRSASV